MGTPAGEESQGKVATCLDFLLPDDINTSLLLKVLTFEGPVSSNLLSMSHSDIF